MDGKGELSKVDEGQKKKRRTEENSDADEGKAVDDALSVLVETLKKREKMLKAREKELEAERKAFEKEKEHFGASIKDEGSKQNDVLDLSVGGTVISVSRKTLTQVEGSMLASLFSGRWDDSIEKDRDGNFFINQPPDLFIPLIDFFRDKLCETPARPTVASPTAENIERMKFAAFLRMVEFYGLTPGVYPCIIELHSGLVHSCEITDYPNLGVTANDWSVFTLKPKGHSRKILSYEVKLGHVENFQLGWMYPQTWAADTSKKATTKVGEHGNSFGLDLCASGFQYGGRNLSLAENVTVTEGDVIRCDNRDGKLAWYINGTLVNGQPARFPDGLSPYLAQVVPAFSGKGQWSITTVELD